MMNEAPAAEALCFLKVPGPAVLLGELGERNRRRVFLDPTPKLLDTRGFRHAADLTRYGAETAISRLAVL